MSFGHCGIDWLHSLLDSHPQILIMPAFDYYRTWKILEASKINNSNEMIDKWCSYLNSNEMQGKDTKLFYNDNESIVFKETLSKNLDDKSLDRVNFLWAIIDAFSNAKKININNINNIVIHVHTCLPYNEIIKDFSKPNILMIVRDPRACFAGWFKIFTKKFGHLPDYYNHYVDETFEQWMLGKKILYEYLYKSGDKSFILKNEDMVSNLEKEMRKVAKWLKISFNESMLFSTYPSGIEWVPDSGYISKDGIYPEEKSTYFLPENVKKRWLGELKDKREILMIEFLTKHIMSEFNYKRIFKNNFYNNIKGFWYYLLPHRGPKRLFFYKPTNDEFNRILNRLNLSGRKKSAKTWLMLPKKIKIITIWFNSLFKHIIILFFPGDRWRRYDLPNLENTYRDYE